METAASPKREIPRVAVVERLGGAGLRPRALKRKSRTGITPCGFEVRLLASQFHHCRLNCRVARRFPRLVIASSLWHVMPTAGGTPDQYRAAPRPRDCAGLALAA